MKVLFVDDDDLDRTRTKGLLEQNGFLVDEAHNEKKALSYAKVYGYNAGIFDLHLTNSSTKMGGLELIGNVRRLSREKDHFPILVLTRRIDIETEIKVFEAGASDFISKPFSPGILLTRLHRIILEWERVERRRAAMLIEHGPITLNLIKAEVRVKNVRIELPPAEFRFVRYLMMTKRAVSTEELINHLYDSNSRADRSDIQSLVRRVRLSLDPEQKLDPIRTAREISGYGLRQGNRI